MSPAVTKRISKKKRQIMETAAGLFTRFGVRRVSVEEICHRAGASKMTFYRYFANKMELLKYIWRQWIEEGFLRLDQIDSLDIPFHDKMKIIIEYKMELASKMSPEFIEEVFHADPQMTPIMDEMLTDVRRPFMDFVAKAQGRGDMRNMHPQFILAVIDKLYELVHDDHLRKTYHSHAELVREVNSFLFFGMLPWGDRED